MNASSDHQESAKFHKNCLGNSCCSRGTGVFWEVEGLVIVLQDRKAPVKHSWLYTPKRVRAGKP